jgi:hypothetical protein
MPNSETGNWKTPARDDRNFVAGHLHVEHGADLRVAHLHRGEAGRGQTLHRSVVEGVARQASDDHGSAQLRAGDDLCRPERSEGALGDLFRVRLASDPLSSVRALRGVLVLATCQARLQSAAPRGPRSHRPTAERPV